MWRSLFGIRTYSFTQNMRSIYYLLHTHTHKSLGNRQHKRENETAYRKKKCFGCQDKLKKSWALTQTYYTQRSSIKCIYMYIGHIVGCCFFFFHSSFSILKTVKHGQKKVSASSKWKKYQKKIVSWTKNKVRFVGEMYPNLTPMLD